MIIDNEEGSGVNKKQNEEFSTKRLLSNILFFGVSYAINYGVSKFVEPKKYLEYNEKLSTIADAFPGYNDTPFTALKRAGKLYEELNFKPKKFSSVGEVIAHVKYLDQNTKIYYDSVFINNFFPLLISMELATKENFCYIGSDTASVYLYKLSNGRKIWTFEQSNMWGDYTTEKFLANFEYSSIITDIFAKCKSAAYMKYDEEKYKITIEPLRHETLIEDNLENVGYDKEKERVLLEEINSFTGKSQRSYLFVGPPGTGKTTACLQLARRISNSILKIDTSVLRIAGTNLFDAIIKFTGVKVIIVDDIDRLSEKDVAMNSLLYALESFKALETKPLFLATANDTNKLPAAAIRPGRFDKIIEYPSLSSEERRDWILRIKLVGDVEKLVEATDGYSHAFMKEIEKQHLAGATFDEIYKDVVTRNKFSTSKTI